MQSCLAQNRKTTSSSSALFDHQNKNQKEAFSYFVVSSGNQKKNLKEEDLNELIGILKAIQSLSNQGRHQRYLISQAELKLRLNSALNLDLEGKRKFARFIVECANSNGFFSRILPGAWGRAEKINDLIDWITAERDGKKLETRGFIKRFFDCERMRIQIKNKGNDQENDGVPDYSGAPSYKKRIKRNELLDGVEKKQDNVTDLPEVIQQKFELYRQQARANPNIRPKFLGKKKTNSVHSYVFFKNGPYHCILRKSCVKNLEKETKTNARCSESYGIFPYVKSNSRLWTFDLNGKQIGNQRHMTMSAIADKRNPKALYKNKQMMPHVPVPVALSSNATATGYSKLEFTDDKGQHRTILLAPYHGHKVTSAKGKKLLEAASLDQEKTMILDLITIVESKNIQNITEDDIRIRKDPITGKLHLTVVTDLTRMSTRQSERKEHEMDSSLLALFQVIVSLFLNQILSDDRLPEEFKTFRKDLYSDIMPTSKNTKSEKVSYDTLRTAIEKVFV